MTKTARTVDVTLLALPISLPIVLVVLSLAACPPDLTGVGCRTDCDCPLAETCVQTGGALTCQNGTNLCGGADGGNPGGGDGGGLFGNVTLNGGTAKPSGNTAWVYIWNQNPDGGAAPLTTLTADAKGHFSYPEADATTSYYLQAEYNIDASGQLHNSTDKYQSAGPVQRSASPVSLDVQTGSCIIFANHTSASNDPGPQLWEAIADIPDVQTGLELTTGVTAIVSYAGGEQTLQYEAPGNPDPLSAGKWAFIAPAASRPAAQATYDFRFTAPSYNGAACDVTRASLTGFPTGIGLTVDGGAATTWDTTSTATDAVTWTPPTGATLTLVNLTGPLGVTVYDSVETTPNATSYPFSGKTVPSTACPSTGVTQCISNVTSLLEQATGNALSLEGASSSLKFQTQ